MSKYVLSNASGLSLSIVEYGATIIGVTAPDKDGICEEISLNYKSLDELVAKYGPHFGCLAGRYANRIKSGKFEIDGESFQLNLNNNGINHLHGGRFGFDTKVWSSRIVETDSEKGVEFVYLSPDGDELYPGTLEATFSVMFSNIANEFTFSFGAKALDRPTVVNLTNHTYWNLSGDLRTKILDHTLQLSCGHYIPVTTPAAIPTGEIAPVRDTPFDFTTAKKLSKGILQIEGGGQQGIDHCFVVTNAFDESGSYRHNPALQKVDKKAFLRHIATVTDPVSGRCMTVHGTQPGVQVYTANFLSKDPAAHPFVQHNGMCLETNHFPDSPNNPNFPSTLLRPTDEPYFHQTVHTFSVV